MTFLRHLLSYVVLAYCERHKSCFIFHLNTLAGATMSMMHCKKSENKSNSFFGLGRAALLLTATTFGCASKNSAQPNDLSGNGSQGIAHNHEVIGEIWLDPPMPLPVDSQTDAVAICGDVNDLQHVEFYGVDGPLFPEVSREFVDKYNPPTVQFQWLRGSEIRAKNSSLKFSSGISGWRSCTGTLLRGDHVLTAAHCFKPLTGDPNVELVPGSPIPRFVARGPDTPYELHGNKRKYLAYGELADLMQVNFYYQKNEESGRVIHRTGNSDERKTALRVHPVVRLVEHSKGSLDYALVEVGTDEYGDRAESHTLPVTLDKRLLQDGESIRIFQHPKTEMKQIGAGKVEKLTRVRVDGVVRPVRPSEIFYGTIDSKEGSSGAGIIDAAGNLVGVHTNAGCLSKERGGGGHNRGVSILSISNVSEKLSSLVDIVSE